MNVIDQIGAPAPSAIALPRGLPERIGRVAAPVALLAVVACGVIIAVDSAQTATDVVAGSPRYFPGWLKGPLHLLPGSKLSAGTYSELTYAMCLAFLVLVACARWVGVRAAIAAVVLLQVAYLLTPPLGSNDVWNYVGYSHLGALHGLSPYSHAPIAAPHDPAYRFVSWPTLKTPYGPLFTVISYAFAPLGVAGGLWAMKALMTASAAVCLWLVWRLAKRLGVSPVAALLLVGTSPIWTIWLLGGAHNDVLMMALALGGIAFWVSGRDFAAAFVLVLAAAVKAPALLFLPFFVIAAHDRRRALWGVLAGAAVVVAVSLAAFGSLQPITAFQQQTGFHTNRSVIGEVFRLFSSPAGTPSSQLPLEVAFVLALVALAVWVWRGGNPIAAAGWAAAALVAAMLWEFPWYLAWVLPLAALTRDTRLKIAGLTMMVVLLVAYVPPSLFLT